MNFVVVFSFLRQNLNPTGLYRKLETTLERDYVKMIWDTCVPHKFSTFVYFFKKIIHLCQPHITYQKANNIVLKFIEEDLQNLELLKDALREHIRTIQYVYSLLFLKICNRSNKFGIKDKSQFGFFITNWRHHKNNVVLTAPLENCSRNCSSRNQTTTTTTTTITATV